MNTREGVLAMGVARRDQSHSEEPRTPMTSRLRGASCDDFREGTREYALRHLLVLDTDGIGQVDRSQTG